MKRVNVSGILLFLCIFSFTGCADDDEKENEIYPLSFEKAYYETPLLGEQSISIRGGNRDYTVTVEKTSILDVSIDLSNPVGMGNLKINPKQKGETIVTVKDNVTKDIVDLKVKVIDGYLAYAIKSSNHPALTQKTIVYLINNEAKDCYFFGYDDSSLNSNSTLITKGTYGFSIKLEYGIGNSSPTYTIPYLTLNYASDEQGNFTDAAIPPTPHKLRFEMNDGVTNSSVMNIIQVCLGVDWKELASDVLKSTKSEAHVPTLKTTIDDTDYVIIGTLSTIPAIPENIID